jgi:hypothetical protein
LVLGRGEEEVGVAFFLGRTRGVGLTDTTRGAAGTLNVVRAKAPRRGGVRVPFIVIVEEVQEVQGVQGVEVGVVGVEGIYLSEERTLRGRDRKTIGVVEYPHKIV